MYIHFFLITDGGSDLEAAKAIKKNLDPETHDTSDSTESKPSTETLINSAPVNNDSNANLNSIHGNIKLFFAA